MKRRSRVRSWLIVGFVAFSTAAPACLNDRDTLADEAKKNRDLLTTLVGGFERNPPLYYEMRIKRIEGDLKANPKLIDEYDDIAVASDRIGNDDAAIKWIEAKKSQLAPLDMKSDTSKDEWYRYFANCGTFLVHRWAKQGAKSAQIGDVDLGCSLIEQALKINPTAHFGREKYQLAVMKWLIQCGDGQSEPLPYFLQDPGSMVRSGLDEQYRSSFRLSRADANEAVTGLSGLIRLGGAWQSPDIYMAIGSILNDNPVRPNPLVSVALLRAKEILDSGGKSFDPDFKTIDGELYHAQNTNYLNASEMGEYRRLRNLAEKWNSDRESFMLARLKAGRHPDADSHFWYGAPAMPDFSVRQSYWTYLTSKVLTPYNIIFLVCPGLPILLVILYILGSIRRSNLRKSLIAS